MVYSISTSSYTSSGLIVTRCGRVVCLKCFIHIKLDVYKTVLKAKGSPRLPEKSCLNIDECEPLRSHRVQRGTEEQGLGWTQAFISTKTKYTTPVAKRCPCGILQGPLATFQDPAYCKQTRTRLPHAFIQWLIIWPSHSLHTSSRRPYTLCLLTTVN